MPSLEGEALLDASPPALAGLPAVLHRYLRDLVYGALDGVITTFAVVAGVAGASLSARVVLILGIANLVADGVSMGASNYLGIRSERAARDAHGHAGGAPLGVESAAIRHGAATFVAFVVAGIVPLAAYLLPIAAADRFAWATVLTLAALFLVGAARSLVTRQPWWSSGLEMLAVGAAAAAIAYGLGRLIAVLTGGQAPAG